MDTRFTNLTKTKKIKIVARSIFLQGVLLHYNKELPFYFKKWKKIWKAIEDLKEKYQISFLEVNLNFISQILKKKKINSFIIGIDSISHLEEILDKIKFKNNSLNYRKIFSNNKNLIDPRNWKNV